MGKALYRKYRSRSLDEIVGQEHVTALLRRALERKRVAHAYLFTGPRGTGKTSIARIMAHEINDLPYSDESSHLDIIEIDAASNNGVDDIRDLREKVHLAPASAKKKVYIIDEVHMLSKPAFNALLKTLEEPPEHVVFILATTDVEKLPETIISRTQRHTFRRASLDELVQNMQRIADSEKISVAPEALHIIAEHSDGGYRDSVSLLDQLANSVGKDEEILPVHIEQSLGLVPANTIADLLHATNSGDIAGIVTHLKTLESRGVQAKTISQQIIRYIRNHASETPYLLSLMSDLIEVGQSSLPSAKLLAILGSYRNGAIDGAPATNTSTSFSEDSAFPTAVTQDKMNQLAGNGSEEKEGGGVSDGSKEQESEQIAPKPTRKNSKKKPLQNIELDWKKFTEDVRAASIALYSVIAKCGHEIDQATLKLYTKNEFYKKKLDNPRALGLLQSALQNQADTDWDIQLVVGTKPPADSQAAAIAAMMGGGEEVQLDD